MKKIFLILFAVLTISLFAEGTPDADSKTRQAAYNVQQNAFTQYPVPGVQYFVERATVKKWVERWDKPSVITYVYLISYGKMLGYYVCNGKPASTKSYLVPEESVGGGGSAGYYTEQRPDLDGTYGDNNPGIRFFTAEGTAVEWAGGGASYIYSDAPLPLDVPKLNVTKK